VGLRRRELAAERRRGCIIAGRFCELFTSSLRGCGHLGPILLIWRINLVELMIATFLVNIGNGARLPMLSILRVGMASVAADVRVVNFGG
jgi:hypothetical protein